jgi:hypothetical protein
MLFRNKDGDIISIRKSYFINDTLYYKFIIDNTLINKTVMNNIVINKNIHNTQMDNIVNTIKKMIFK